MHSLADYRFAIVDLETTGGRAGSDRITEIALLGVEQATVVEAWSELIDPGIPIPPFIQSLTGITPELVANRPAFAEIADRLHGMLDGRILVAHNARFDYAFLKNSFKRLDRLYTPRILCTVKLSRFLNPGRSTHKLDSLIEDYDLPCGQRHRAMGDARVLWDLIKYWIEEQGVARVIEGIERVMKRPALPPHLDPAEIDAIPDAPGVYLFHGDREVPLYIGKSVRLKTRVLSHFASDHANARELEIAQQVRHIEIHRTAGDLGAQLLESRLIKQRQPLYNRRLRRQGRLTFFILAEDERGYLTLQLRQSMKLPEHPAGRVIGLFRSRRAAETRLREWVAQHGLCQRLTGLERKSSGACFAYQLKKCRGACCGQESADAYNARLLEVVDNWHIKVWPYDSPYIIEEKGEDMTAYHLVDQWRHLDTQAAPGLLQTPTDLPMEFDYDTYRILTRALLRQQA
jgi:DNA polymerase-3 subunit epsilon